MNKWIIGVLVLLAVVVVVGLVTRKSVRAEILIEATPDEVWAVITDPSSYPDWNPIFVSYEGVFAEGSQVALQMKMGEGDPTRVQVEVEDFVPREWMHQGGGYPLILTYDHNWYLEAVPEGTKVTQYEYYTGIYVLFWDPTACATGLRTGKQKPQGEIRRLGTLDERTHPPGGTPLGCM